MPFSCKDLDHAGAGTLRGHWAALCALGRSAALLFGKAVLCSFGLGLVFAPGW